MQIERRRPQVLTQYSAADVDTSDDAFDRAPLTVRAIDSADTDLIRFTDS
jgi:hypothetical protein